MKELNTWRAAAKSLVKHYTHRRFLFDVKKERKLDMSRCFWSWGRMVVSLNASFYDVYFHIKSSGGVIESAQVKARLPIRMLQCSKFST